MIDLLVKYAQDRGLVIEPGFAPKTVRWAIHCTASGQYAGVVPIGDTDSRKNPGREFSKCPDLSQPELVGGSQARSHFLIETTDVVALHLKGDEDEGKLTKIRDKHAFFVRMLRDASSAMPELRLAAELLDDPQALRAIAADLKDKKAKPSDKVTIAFPNGFPVESEAWHDWWRAFRSTLKEPEPLSAARMICFVTGEEVEPTRTHPKVVGLADVGGQPTGDALVCYDKEAFASFGLGQSANGAMSEEAAHAYRAALNEILKQRGHRLAGAKVAYWYKDAGVKPQDDPLGFLSEPQSDEDLDDDQRKRAAAHAQRRQEHGALNRARELLDAVRSGRRPDLARNHFYALTLSGAAGRVMVRDWMQGLFTQLVEHINAWFDDLAIVARDGRGPAPPPKFMAVLGATVRDLKDLPAPFVSKLWRVAVCREPIPQHALALALARAKIDIIQDQPPNHARMGLIRAYHCRKGDTNMTVQLNKDYPNAAYQCGRLMAVLAGAQQAALGDVGAGVVQRFYAAASATPALVLGRLITNSKNHLNAIRKQRPALAKWFENSLAEICSHIHQPLPTALDLEAQSLFAIGYYHQIAERPEKVEAPSDNEAGDAP